MTGVRACAWLLITMLVSSCANVRYTEPGKDATGASPAYRNADLHWRRVAVLSDELLAMDARISPGDAAAVAQTAIFYPLELADDYQLTSPPLWHNTLVNVGLRPRGLCVDWTADLLDELQSLDLASVSFHWGVANHDATFRIEHSTAVVTARGQPFATGMVLDPWRDSGRLYWARVAEDPEYHWSDLREVRDAERTAARATDPALTITRR